MPTDLSDIHQEQDRAALELYQQRAAAALPPPSMQQVADHLGMRHATSALRVIRRLEATGRLANSGEHRGVRLAQPVGRLTIPLRCVVSCGPGIEAEDEGDRLDLSRMFGRDDLAAFKASGESMVDDGIQPGDFLIVREEPEPASGQKIVAMLDRGMVCKKYHLMRNGMVQLRSCNRTAPHIDVDPSRGHFRILGVLHYVIRKC